MGTIKLGIIEASIELVEYNRKYNKRQRLVEY